MKRYLHFAGIAVSVASIIAVTMYVVRISHTMDITLLLHGRAALGVTVAAIASAAIIPISAIAWRQLLASCGECRRWSSLATIMGITQLAKYVPGNIGQHIGRLSFAAREGMALGTAATTVVAESVLAVVAAAGVGAASCLLVGGPIVEQWFPSVDRGWLSAMGAALATAIVAVVLLTPRLISAAVRRGTAGRISPKLPGGPALLQAFLLYVGNYIVLGAGITTMARLVADVSWHDAALLTGTFAAAWIIGFFVPGAPAGLGVREGVMLALLHSANFGADATVIVIAIRVATTTGDLLCFLVASAAHIVERRRFAATISSGNSRR